MKKIQEFRGMEERNYNLLFFFLVGGIKLSPIGYRLWEYSSEQNKTPRTELTFQHKTLSYTIKRIFYFKAGKCAITVQHASTAVIAADLLKGQQTCNLVTQLYKSQRGKEVQGEGFFFFFDALNRSRIPENLPLGNGERRKGRWRTEERKIKISPTMLHPPPPSKSHTLFSNLMSELAKRRQTSGVSFLGMYSRGNVPGTNLHLWAVTGVKSQRYAA